jgi:hypothetical protein
LALTNSQLQSRLETLELTVNDCQTALNNVATRRELKTLMALIEAQVSSLQDVIGTVDATGALYPPRYTTTERDAETFTQGAMIYNTTLGKFQGYDGSSWSNLS